MLRPTAFRTSLLLSVLLAGPLYAAPDLLPSEATTLMVRAMQHQPTAQRTTITGPIAERMKTEDLDDTEIFLKAEAHFINFEPEPSRDTFWRFRNRDDDFGRVAWQRLMIIRVNAFEMTDEVVEKDLPNYRDRFRIRPDDRYGISYPLMQAARQLIERGEASRALDLVVDEVRRHDRFDAPYFAYRLPQSFISVARDHGRGEEFETLHQWVVQGLTEAIENRLAESPAPERNAVGLAGAMLGTLFEDQRLDYHDWTAEFLKLKAALDQGND